MTRAKAQCTLTNVFVRKVVTEPLSVQAPTNPPIDKRRASRFGTIVTIIYVIAYKSSFKTMAIH